MDAGPRGGGRDPRSGGEKKNWGETAGEQMGGWGNHAVESVFSGFCPALGTVAGWGGKTTPPQKAFRGLDQKTGGGGGEPAGWSAKKKKKFGFPPAKRRVRFPTPPSGAEKAGTIKKKD